MRNSPGWTVCGPLNAEGVTQPREAPRTTPEPATPTPPQDPGKQAHRGGEQKLPLLQVQSRQGLGRRHIPPPVPAWGDRLLILRQNAKIWSSLQHRPFEGSKGLSWKDPSCPVSNSVWILRTRAELSSSPMGCCCPTVSLSVVGLKDKEWSKGDPQTRVKPQLTSKVPPTLHPLNWCWLLEGPLTPSNTTPLIAFCEMGQELSKHTFAS